MSAALNGTPTVHDQLAEAKARLELTLTQARQTFVDRRARRLRESWDRIDSWGVGALGLWARVRDAEGRELIAPHDLAHFRAHGANWPFWRTWAEHARLRADSRFLCTTNNTARGVVRALCAYIVGTGFTYRFAPRREGLEVPRPLLDALNEIVEDFHTLNAWQPLELELCGRARRDGEWFLRHFVDEEGHTRVSTVEPAEVIEDGRPREEGSFGIVNPPEDVTRHTHYLVSYTGYSGDIENEGKGVPAAELVHCKVNVDRRVKRGMPDFVFGTHDLIRTAARALENMGEATADQAALTEIVQHAAASADQVQAFVDDLGDIELPDVWRSTNQEVRIRRPGTRLDIDKGQEYVVPPFAQNVPGFVAATQAVMRSAAVCWNAPEWITSADASNSNYASSLTAENPFVKRMQQEQKELERHFLRTHWLAVEALIRARGGALKVGGQSYDLRTIRHLVTLQVEPPRVEWRNKQEQASVDQTYVSLGLKSRQTAAQEQGLDWEKEQANIEAYNDSFGEAKVHLGIPGEPGDLDIEGEPPLGLGGSGGKGGGRGQTPVQQELEVIKGKVSMLGPITALQKQVYAGEMPHSAGVAALSILLGIPREQAEQLLPQEQGVNLTAEGGQGQGGAAPGQEAPPGTEGLPPLPDLSGLTEEPPPEAPPEAEPAPAPESVGSARARIARAHGEAAARLALLAAADLLEGRTPEPPAPPPAPPEPPPPLTIRLEQPAAPVRTTTREVVRDAEGNIARVIETSIEEAGGAPQVTAWQVQRDAAGNVVQVSEARQEAPRPFEEAVVPNKTGPGCHDDKTGHPAECPGKQDDKPAPKQDAAPQKPAADPQQKVEQLGQALATVKGNLEKGKAALAAVKKNASAAARAAKKKGATDLDRKKAQDAQTALTNVQAYVDKTKAAQKNLKAAHKDATKAARAAQKPARKAPAPKKGAPGKAARPAAAQSPVPTTATPRKQFGDPSESKAVADLAAGTSKHVLHAGTGAGNEDTMLTDLMKESGRADPPQVLGKKGMNDLKAKGWKVMYRGVSDAKYTEQFRSGDLYNGSGYYGNGTYAAMVPEGGDESATLGHAAVYAGKGGAVMRMALSPEAKIVSHDDLQKEMGQYREQLGQDYAGGKISTEQYHALTETTRDAGRFAVLRNYDAIHEPKNGYTVVLNRSIVAVEDRDQPPPRKAARGSRKK